MSQRPIPTPEAALFIHCGGQDDNIGDVVLRRAMYRRFRGTKKKYVLLLDQSKSFEEGLELDSDVKIVRNRNDFRNLALAYSRKGHTIFVENAGELQARLRSVARQVETARWLRALGKNGGASFKLGVGYRQFPGLYRHLLSWALSHYSLVRWRDGRSQAWTGVGETMPDWGFVDTGPAGWTVRHQRVIGEPPARDKIAISIRYDRPFPSPSWVEGVRQFCRSAELDPVIVTQVRRDAPRSAELAAALEASEVTWPEEMSHNEQEIRLRYLYRSSALVLSDRLHVLVLGFTEGAIPFNLTEYPDHKTGRHFDVVGYERSAINCVGASAGEIERFLFDALGRGGELPACRRKIDVEMRKLDVAIDALIFRGNDERSKARF